MAQNSRLQSIITHKPRQQEHEDAWPHYYISSQEQRVVHSECLINAPFPEDSRLGQLPIPCPGDRTQGLYIAVLLTYNPSSLLFKDRVLPYSLVGLRVKNLLPLPSES